MLRVLFVALCGAAGLLPLALGRGSEAEWIFGVLAGLLFGLLVVALAWRLRRIPGKAILHALSGLVVGLLVGRVVYAAVAAFLVAFPPFIRDFAETLCVIG